MPVHLRFGAVLALAALLWSAAPAHAQIRPTDRVPLEQLDRGFVRCGAGWYGGQSATLAGTRGTMTQLGECTVQVAHDGVTFRIDGVAQRRFHDEAQLFAPAPGVAASGPDRSDAGEWAVEAVVPLRGWLPALRVGVRLPTTDDRAGLERDATDAYATLAGLRTIGPVWLMGEVGVGIHGTRNLEREQQDVLLYAMAAGARRGRVAGHVALVGHHFWLNEWTERGNENLAEVRTGADLELGERWSVGATAVRGLAEYSPESAVSVALTRTLGSAAAR